MDDELRAGLARKALHAVIMLVEGQRDEPCDGEHLGALLRAVEEVIDRALPKEVSVPRRSNDY